MDYALSDWLGQVGTTLKWHKSMERATYLNPAIDMMHII
jgi:hypothetical protein